MRLVAATALVLLAMPGCSLLGLFDEPADVACDVGDDCPASADPCLVPFCDAELGACRARYRDTDADGDGDHRCASLSAAGTASDCADDDPIVSSIAVEACDEEDQDCDGRIDEDCRSPEALALGEDFSCALRDGAVLCWGASDRGQLGPAGRRRVAPGRPVPVPLPTRAIAIAAGDGHACALDEAGTVRCWGDASSGQLANAVSSIDASSSVPVEMPVRDVRQLAASARRTCALTALGDVWCWGSNEYDAIDPLLPPIVRTPARVTQRASSVACGTGTTCAMAGGIHCRGAWPMEYDGADVTAIAASQGGICTLDVSGTVACAGGATFGELGDGTDVQRDALGPVPGPIARALVASAIHVCAIDTIDRAWCWGGSSSGQTGLGLVEAQRTAAIVPALDPVASIAVGRAHTCAVLRAGGVACFGQALFGESGAPPESYALEPRRVRGI